MSKPVKPKLNDEYNALRKDYKQIDNVLLFGIRV